MRSLNEVIQKAQTFKRRPLVVAAAADPYVLDAVDKAVQRGLVEPILIGDTTLIESQASSDVLKQATLIDQPDNTLACEAAVEYCFDHPEAILMKGLVDTSVLLKTALRKEKGLRTEQRLSHVSVFEIKDFDRLLMMTDGAMNIAPDVDEKENILKNAVVLANALDVTLPKVAVIAAVEKVNPKMPATLDAALLMERQRSGKIEHCIVEGPYAIDNAINVAAAKHKGITLPYAGRADILLMPDIEAGNIFYKGLMFLGDAQSASLIMGATHPIVLTSRADSSESKFLSIALAVCVSDYNLN
jgi:phosphate butyryltransferase